MPFLPIRNIIRIRKSKNASFFCMSDLDQALAKFLRQEKGDGSYAALARKLGMAESSLYRLVHGEQSATLRGLEKIMRQLQISPREVFGEEIQRKRGRRG